MNLYQKSITLNRQSATGRYLRRTNFFNACVRPAKLLRSTSENLINGKHNLVPDLIVGGIIQKRPTRLFYLHVLDVNARSLH